MQHNLGDRYEHLEVPTPPSSDYSEMNGEKLYVM